MCLRNVTESTFLGIYTFFTDVRRKIAAKWPSQQRDNGSAAPEVISDSLEDVRYPGHANTL